MVAFKSRKQKNLKKQRKNKTKHLKKQRKNKTKHRNCTLKKSKHKSYKKTRHYYNIRQYLGGGPEDSESSYTPPMAPGWESPPSPERTVELSPSPNSPVVSPLDPPAVPPLNPPAVPPLVPLNSPPPPSPSPPSPSPPPPSPSPWRNPPSRPPPLPSQPSSNRPFRPPLSLGSVLPQQQSYILEQPGFLVVMIAGSLGLLCICICNASAMVDRVSDGVRDLGNSMRNMGRDLHSLTRRPRRLQFAPNPTQDIEMQSVQSVQPVQEVPLYYPTDYEEGYVPGFTAYNADDECGVCLEAYKDTPDMPITRVHKCGHIFHTQCIDDWFIRGKRNCPICKLQVESQEPGFTRADPAFFKGGANSLLDTIAELLKDINKLETSALTKTLMIYFDFLNLKPKHFGRIVELLQTINKDINLEELITILAHGLGLNCSENNKTLESSATMSDERLAKILGANGESIINAIVQKCSSGNDLNLTAKQFKDVESIKNSLAKTLSSYYDEPNKKQAEKRTKKQLLRDFELSRTTLISILN